MEQAGLRDFVLELIRQAEIACHDTNPRTRETARMVYVGDVYAVMLTRADGVAGRAEPSPRDSVWPFIR